MYGLIGEKLGHSYSKIIHEMLGRYSYKLIELKKDELENFIKTRRFQGLNVTIPYKQAVMPYCDNISDLAKEIGAVNTLYFDSAGKLMGTNTDYKGFIYAMKAVNIDVFGCNVLILGDGATSQTIRKAIFDLRASNIYIASRKISGIEKEGNFTFISYDRFSEIAQEIDVVINSTPVGMYPNMEGTPCDLEEFPNCKGIFDVVYNPSPTKFLEQGKKLGMKHSGGLAMLVAQATAAAGYFTGNGDVFEKENPRIIKELEEIMKK